MIYKKLHLKDNYPFLGSENADPTLECYLPYNMVEMNMESNKRPVLLICPGGGYAMCSERESEPIALNFLSAGFNCFIIKYSVLKYHYPTQIREVAAAMEMIYSNADEWNCDVNKIAIIGFSAGAHLAAHYANSYDCNDVRKVFENSKPVNAELLCYPVISSDPDIANKGSFENLLGHYPLTDEETKQLSCEKLVTKNTPPTFLWHTAEDACVPVANSLVYAESLAKSNVPFTLHIFPYGYHGLSTADEMTCDNLPENYAMCNDWIVEAKKWLKTVF